jgi:hypothetical protein
MEVEGKEVRVLIKTLVMINLNYKKLMIKEHPHIHHQIRQDFFEDPLGGVK